MDISQLNHAYGIAGQLEFIEAQSGFPLIKITNAQAIAVISLYAGHVVSYQPTDAAEDLMFLSESVIYKIGKGIRGGVPICWPWFGADPEGLGRSSHGFVRDRHWQVRNTETTTTGATRVILGLSDSPVTRAIWDYSFELAIAITVGKTLDLELVTRNTGDQTFTITQALHSYFNIGDISRVKVLGLANCDYVDKVDGGKIKTQLGEIAISGEVDRVYSNAPAELLIEDPAFARKIRLTSKNSTTAVVWNPWIEKAAAMADLGDQYTKMICVETANAGMEIIEIAPKAEYHLAVSYRIEY